MLGIPTVGNVLAIEVQRTLPRAVDMALPRAITRCLQEEPGFAERFDLDHPFDTAFHEEVELTAPNKPRMGVIAHPRFG